MNQRKSITMYLPRQRLFWAVSLGHMTNDVFMSMGPVLLAFLAAHVLPISAAQIGTAVSAREMAGALSQPFFGWLGDRIGGRWLTAGGVAWVVVFLMLAIALAFAGQFWMMVIPYALSALGSGAFHPMGAMYAAEASQERTASNVSIFFLFGQLGLGAGPMLAGFVLDRAVPAAGQAVASSSLFPLFALSLLAVPGVLFMATSVPGRVHTHPRTATAAISGQTDYGWRDSLKPLLLLGALVVLRGFSGLAAANFLPVLLTRKGWDPASYGVVTGLFMIASAFSAVVFGQLADRFDRRLLIAGTMLVSAPAFFLLPLADGILPYLLSLWAGWFSGASFSIIIVLAQRVVPGSKGFASGAILGFTFAAGALASLVIGILADGSGGFRGIGLDSTFQVVAITAALAALTSLALPAATTRPMRRVSVEAVS